MLKKLSLSILTLFLPLSLFADDTMAASLKQNMKQLGTLAKQIGTTISDTSKNQANAAGAAQMTELFKTVYAQAAEGVKDIPADQQEQAIVEFQDLITQEISLSTQLQQAFLDNDNALAAQILQKMTDIKKDGHGKFKE